MRRFSQTLLLLVGLLMAVAPLGSTLAAQTVVPAPAVPDQTAVWPTEGWQTATPESQGMDSEQLITVFETIDRIHQITDSERIHHVLVVRHGYVVLDAPIYPVPPNQRHRIYSATKSVVSTLMGIAIEQGFIGGLDTRLVDIFADYPIANMDDDKAAITVEDLLTMQAGLEWQEGGIPYGLPANTVSQMFISPSWVQFVLDQPMANAPGSRFVYNSGVSFLLGAAVEEVSGIPLAEFADDYLFGPLGMSPHWEVSSEGIPNGGFGLHLTPHDMAKFGYLFLREGQWAEQSIVSPEWVAAATTNWSPPGAGPAYGFQWWIGANGLFRASGLGGQKIIVDPELDLVIVITAAVESGRNTTLVADAVVDAIVSDGPLPDDPASYTRLAQIQAEAAAGPPPQAVPPLPDVVQSIDGQTYFLDDNRFGWRAFSLDFTATTATLTLMVDDQTQVYALGLDATFCLTELVAPGLFGSGHMVASQGNWIGPNAFQWVAEDTSDIRQGQTTFRFEDDMVTIELRIQPFFTNATLTGHQ